jgi:hypothetical protein
MTESPQAKESDRDDSKNWGYALILLAGVSLLFLSLRLSGRAFITLDLEILIIYMPTLVCLLVYAREVSASHKTRSGRFGRGNTVARPGDIAVQ